MSKFTGPLDENPDDALASIKWRMDSLGPDPADILEREFVAPRVDTAEEHVNTHGNTGVFDSTIQGKQAEMQALRQRLALLASEVARMSIDSQLRLSQSVSPSTANPSSAPTSKRRGSTGSSATGTTDKPPRSSAVSSRGSGAKIALPRVKSKAAGARAKSATSTGAALTWQKPPNPRHKSASFETAVKPGSVRKVPNDVPPLHKKASFASLSFDDTCSLSMGGSLVGSNTPNSKFNLSRSNSKLAGSTPVPRRTKSMRKEQRLAAAAQLPATALVGEDGSYHGSHHSFRRSSSVSRKKSRQSTPSKQGPHRFLQAGKSPGGARGSAQSKPAGSWSRASEGVVGVNSNGAMGSHEAATAHDMEALNWQGAQEPDEALVQLAVNASLTEAEVAKFASKHKSSHMRSSEVSHKMVVELLREPVVHEEPHRETFFESFYDLILVVVFIKLSFLKYNFSATGLLVLFALFANFWSCWSLMNTYVTMLHQEDYLHRLYYVLHISAAFVMALTVEHPSHPFFNFEAQAWYLAAASILGRVFTAGMWVRAGCFDLEGTRQAERAQEAGSKRFSGLSDYQRWSGKRQVAVHLCSIVVAMLLFGLSMLLPLDFFCQWNPPAHGDGGHDEDNSGHDEDNSGGGKGGDGDDDDGSDKGQLAESGWVVVPVCVLWLLAVGVEQYGQSRAVVYMKLPFPAVYAGVRMQAWLMACFGECVIALLIEPIYFAAASQLGALLASFFMILCICTAHFDIVNADQFLHLYMIRGEKAKAWGYMNFQLVFSFAIFVSGVSLKTLMFISATVYDLELQSSCLKGAQQERQERFNTRVVLDTGDGLADFADFADSSSLASAFSSPGDSGGGTGAAGEAARSLLSSLLHGSHGGGGNNSRNLAGPSSSVGWTLSELDELRFKALLLLCISCSGSMISTIAIGYSIPTALPSTKVRCSRQGALLLCLCTLAVPFLVGSVQTACLMHAEANGEASDAKIHSPDEHAEVVAWPGWPRALGGSRGSSSEGLSLVGALMTTSALVLCSFTVLLWSLDPNREQTYAKLEEAAHFEQTKAHLIRRRSVKVADVLADTFRGAREAMLSASQSVRVNLTPLRQRASKASQSWSGSGERHSGNRGGQSGVGATAARVNGRVNSQGSNVRRSGSWGPLSPSSPFSARHPPSIVEESKSNDEELGSAPVTSTTRDTQKEEPLVQGGVSGGAPLVQGGVSGGAPLVQGGVSGGAPLVQGGVSGGASLVQGGVSGGAPEIGALRTRPPGTGFGNVDPLEKPTKSPTPSPPPPPKGAAARTGWGLLHLFNKSSSTRAPSPPPSVKHPLRTPSGGSSEEQQGASV